MEAFFKKSKTIILLALVCLSISAGIPQRCIAQYFVWGQDPCSIKWEQIKTEHFRIVYPKDFAKEAQRVAYLLERAYVPVGESLGQKARRIPVLIHNQGVESNGFVGWAPRRSEFFSQPPSDNYGQDWLEQLVIHEFRHVVQLEKLNHGLTKGLTIVFGEQATAAVAGVYLPFWFIEGDAVATETALSNSGRGRIPSFERGLKAQVIEKGTYSPEKAMFGSYKDFVPDHYELGYLMVAHARSQYGRDIWANVLNDVGRKPYPFAFNRALKKHSGQTTTGLYKETFEDLTQHWQKDPLFNGPGVEDVLNPTSKLYTNYYRPQFFQDSMVVAVKTSLDKIPRIVSIDTRGKESTLCVPGYIDNNSLNVGQEMLIWSETCPDSRWVHRSYSDIFCLKSGSRKRLTQKQRYFSPALSPDGQQIAVIESTPAYDFYISIIDASNGKLIRRYDPPSGTYPMQPSWSGDMQSILIISQDGNGKEILELKLADGSFLSLHKAGFIEISRPAMINGQVYFNAAYCGTEQVYVLDTQKGTSTMLTSAAFGAHDISINNKGRGIYSFYTSDGLKIASLTNVSEAIVFQNFGNHYGNNFDSILSSQEQKPEFKTDSNHLKAYKTEPYSKWNGLLKPHSWGPFYPNAADYEIKPGASILFHNLLSTSFLGLGYEYDWQNNYGDWGGSYEYKGLYPELSMNVKSGKRENIFSGEINNTTLVWQKTSANLKALLPLSFIRGTYVQYFRPSVSLYYIHAGKTAKTFDFFQENQAMTIEYRLSYSLLHRSVARDMRVPLGFSFNVAFMHPLIKEFSAGKILTATSVLYLPGIAAHHSLKLTGSGQVTVISPKKTNTVSFQYSNLVPLARGYTYPLFNKTTSFMFDYKFPFWYPDLSIPYVLYLKRGKANIFYDFSQAYIGNNTYNYSSYGVDITFDLHLMRFLSNIDLGIRIGQRANDKQTFTNLLYSISF